MEEYPEAEPVFTVSFSHLGVEASLSLRVETQKINLYPQPDEALCDQIKALCSEAVGPISQQASHQVVRLQEQFLESLNIAGNKNFRLYQLSQKELNRPVLVHGLSNFKQAEVYNRIRKFFGCTDIRFGWNCPNISHLRNCLVLTKEKPVVDEKEFYILSFEDAIKKLTGRLNEVH